MAHKSRDATAPPVQLRSGAASQSPAIFACNGEYWTIGLADLRFSVRDVKGLSYIQRLLQHPGEEFHALDLLGGPVASAAPENERIEKHESSLPTGVSLRRGLSGDAGEMLDAQAKKEYRRRLTDLGEELEELRQRGDADRADEVQSEIDSLKSEISRAVGLGGRDRRAGSAAERARLNVTRAVRAALEKISEQQAALGTLLDRCIRTGSYCSYLLDPKTPITWQFSVGGAGTPTETPQAEPIFSPGDTSFVRAFTLGSVFVGRDSERAILLRALEEVRSGKGKLVLIDGAAGVGKTRIAAEIAVEASRRGVLTLVGGCYDRADPVPFIPFVEILEAALAQTPNLQLFREALGDDAAEMARLVPQLRRSFPDVPPPVELPPEQSRRLLFGAFAGLVKRVARDSPILFLLDDLHWADEGTLLLLGHLAQLIPELPIMIVGTFRSFEPDPAGKLARTLDELIRRHLVERFSLYGLSESAVADMLRALSGQEPPAATVSLFSTYTEGNPFFVEELFKHLVEQGKLLELSGEFCRDLQLSDIDVPQSLRLVIGRRLARLGDATLKALGTGAVIGHSFTFDLLASATHVGADSLLDYVEEAERAGLITATLEYPEARFRFSHELIRQTVIQQVSAARRQHLHLEIAEALESLHANALEEVANELAHHLLQAGLAADGAKTIRVLSMAAKRARLQGALTETGELYRDALQVLKRMPDTPERDQLELRLQLGIGAVLMATGGYADAGTAAAYQRATDLGERLGDPSQVVLALTGLVTPPLLRGDIDAAQAIADQALAAGQRHGKSKSQIWGQHIVGVVQYHSGHLASAWDHLSEAQTLYSEGEHKKNPQDPGIESLQYMALTAWQLGRADTARQWMNDAISLTDRLNKPFELARTSFYAAYLQALLRDPAAARELAEKGIKWSAEHSIQLYLDASRIVYGWAIAKQGRGAEGVASTRAALESFKASGNRLAIGAFLGFLAEALLSAGLPEEAIATVEQGFSLVPQEPMDISYLWWLRGKLLIESADTSQIQRLDKSRLEDAEKSLRTALTLATNIGAKSYAIRSATSLGRLLAALGKTAEARAIVEPLLKSVTEGFDTLEFVEARQLIEELS